MRKDFGSKPWFYPLPVLVIASYDGDGKADAMTAAWGGLYEADMVELCLSHGHKTFDNIVERKAFTVSFADRAHLREADYVGLVSAHNEADKLSKAGLHTVKSALVDAPVITELPMALECKLVKVNEDGNVIGRIVNISVDESALAADGKPDVAKLAPISYDGVRNEYFVLGGKVGSAFHDGAALK